MKNLLIFIAGAIVLGGGILTGHALYGGQSTQTFGQFNPTGGGTYFLQSPITATQNTITLSSFKEPGSNIPYTMSYLNSDIEYATINPVGPSNPNGTKSEFVSFTGITQNSNGTALLTGVTRGLERSYPYGASSTLAYSQPGQTQFILSATPQYFNEYATLRNSQVISGQWQFTTLPTSTVVCSSNDQFCNKQYIDAGFNQGAATSSFSNMGLVQLATSVQLASSTASSTTQKPLVASTKFATTTPGVLCTNGVWNCWPVAQVSGKISQLWLDLTSSFTVSGQWTFNTLATIFNAGLTSNGPTTLTATTTSSAITSINEIGQTFTSATTTTSWPLAMVIATSTGKVTTGSSLLASSTIGFIGFSQGNLTSGTQVFVQTSGVVSGFSGLTVGRDYYLQDSGAIGTAIGTNEMYVGTAISSTQLALEGFHSMQYVGSAAISGSPTGTAVIPAYVREIVVTTGQTANVSGDLVLYVNGKTSGTVGWDSITGSASRIAASNSCSISGNSLSCSATYTNGGVGQSPSISGTAYFYR